MLHECCLQPHCSGQSLFKREQSLVNCYQNFSDRILLHRFRQNDADVAEISSRDRCKSCSRSESLQDRADETQKIIKIIAAIAILGQQRFATLIACQWNASYCDQSECCSIREN